MRFWGSANNWDSLKLWSCGVLFLWWAIFGDCGVQNVCCCYQTFKRYDIFDLKKMRMMKNLWGCKKLSFTDHEVRKFSFFHNRGFRGWLRGSGFSPNKWGLRGCEVLRCVRHLWLRDWLGLGSSGTCVGVTGDISGCVRFYLHTSSTDTRKGS